MDKAHILRDRNQKLMAMPIISSKDIVKTMRKYHSDKQLITKAYELPYINKSPIKRQTESPINSEGVLNFEN